jgi:hypothetical protein
METTSQHLFELKLDVVDSRDYMPRVNEVKMPCQWLHHCYGGKCPAFTVKNGNFYCARKNAAHLR